ncbi:MAG TPA: DUF4235 domain-containing protein [Acidimicrobiia bacterium]|nr:DUF4235 domain-containing protein [Acidimicrobiia bacterium]
MPDSKALSWKAVSLGAGAIAALMTRRAVAMLWKQLAARPAPDQAADRRVPWMRALSWAVATGVGVSVMNLVAQRSAARVWEAATHETPPPLQPD